MLNKSCIHRHTCSSFSDCLLLEVKRFLSVLLTDCRGPFSERGVVETRQESMNYTNTPLKKVTQLQMECQDSAGTKETFILWLPRYLFTWRLQIVEFDKLLCNNSHTHPHTPSASSLQTSSQVIAVSNTKLHCLVV